LGTRSRPRSAVHGKPRLRLMPYLTLEHLITDDGKIDPIVYRAMVRRRCLNEHGAITLRSMRAAVAHYSAIIPVLIQRAHKVRA
jgi:hypothetical protein